MCGLCSIRSLRKGGVRSLKITGRTADLEDRLYGIFMVRNAIRVAEAETSDEEMLRRMMAIRWGAFGGKKEASEGGKRQLCMLGNSCYYPDDDLLVNARAAYFQDR
jgi:hypothetical protein